MSIDDIEYVSVENYKYPFMMNDFDPAFQQPKTFNINLKFTDDGAVKFAELTKANIGKRLAIFVDNELISVPNIMEPFLEGTARITGDFSEEQFRGIAWRVNKLKYESRK